MHPFNISVIPDLISFTRRRRAFWHASRRCNLPESRARQFAIILLHGSPPRTACRYDACNPKKNIRVIYTERVIINADVPGVPFEIDITRYVNENRKFIVPLKSASFPFQASSVPPTIHNSEYFKRLVGNA
jgi:hypothetical protein